MAIGWSAGMVQRIVSIYFPTLASDRILRRKPVEGPFVLTQFEKSAQRIYCLNEAAQKVGLTPGLSFSDARALYPDLTSQLADPLSDLRFLSVLARWAERYCPIVSIEGSNSLLLDISGAAHLFGGEAQLLDDLLTRLDKAGLSARAGLADTVGAAWAVARYAMDTHRHFGPRQSGACVPEGENLSALANLPVAALRLEPEHSNALRRLGLSTIYDLTQIPRITLSRRFGSSVLLQLDRALGAQSEPVTPLRIETRFAARMSLPEPIGLAEDVLGVTRRLMDQVCQKLQAAHKGARRLRLTAQRVDSANAHAEIGLARPMRDAERMTRLFSRAVDDMDAGFGIERIWLEVLETEPLNLTQTSAYDKSQREGEALADLISRIGNRVGFEQVVRFLPAQSHIPEKSYIISAAAYSEPSGNWQAASDRPLVLFKPEPLALRGAVLPKNFRWRNVRLSIAHAQGPERIQPEWWLDDPEWRTGLRDYWQVQTVQGRRLWLFHTPQITAAHLTAWYVHGEFA